MQTIMTPLVWLLREIIPVEARDLLPQLLDTLLSLMPCHGCRCIVRHTKNSCKPCVVSHALGEIPGVGFRLFNTKRLDALFSLWLCNACKFNLVYRTKVRQNAKCQYCSYTACKFVVTHYKYNYSEYVEFPSGYNAMLRPETEGMICYKCRHARQTESALNANANQLTTK
jgi:hypothetical protein